MKREMEDGREGKEVGKRGETRRTVRGRGRGM